MIYKHRDYLHDSFLEHILANDGHVDIRDTPVLLDVDPLTGELLVPPELFYEVAITYDKKTYVYPVQSKTPGKPTEEEISRALTAHFKN